MTSQIKVELIETMGSDRSIANAAWTSSYDKVKKYTRSDEDVARVVKMLATSGHGTPFESVVFNFWMYIPVFVDRQIVTHRIATHNGLSGRYRTPPSEYYNLPQDVLDICDKYFKKDGTAQIIKAYRDLADNAFSFYQGVLDAAKTHKMSNEDYKRIREIVRGPIGTNCMTERATIMNLRSLSNFLKLRLKPNAQPEIQEAARQMLQLVKDSGICPTAIETLEVQGWNI